MEGAQTNAALETAIVHTRRMEELARFYAVGLGLGPFAPTGPDHLGQQVGAAYLGFDQAEDDVSSDVSSDEDRARGVSLWFTVDDLEAAFERFVALGARVRYAPTTKPWGARLACVLDPDGNRVGLAQRRGPKPA